MSKTTRFVVGLVAFALVPPAAASARPRLDHFRTSWTYPSYTIRFHIHFRLCAPRGTVTVRAVEKSSPPGQDSPVWASNVRTGHSDQWHRCQYHHLWWDLSDEMTGVSRYRVRVLARVDGGAWSNDVRYKNDTYD
jgi:hypothetical protein